MKIYIGVTDKEWYENLHDKKVDEVNFWRPSGNSSFQALNIGELFLFKLHYPNNYIVGCGQFLRYTIAPLSLVWEAYGPANGVNSYY